MPGTIMYLAIYSLVGIFCRIFWNFRIEDKENLPPRQGGILLASNHLSWTDVYMIGATVPVAYRPTWFAKKEVFKNRFTSWFLRSMNVIPLDRGEADRHAYLAAKGALEHGAAMRNIMSSVNLSQPSRILLISTDG